MTESVWDSFRVGQNSVIAPQAAQMAQATGGLAILQHLKAQQDQREIQGALAKGDTAALLKIPGGIDILGKLATQQNAGITGALHSAQLQDLQRKAATDQQQQTAKITLANLLSPQGSYGQGTDQERPTATVAMSDADAVKQLQAAETAGQPATINLPNPANVRALTVAAGNAVPRGTANALMGVGGNGQVMAPRLVQHAESPTGWGYLDPRSGNITPGAPPPASAAKLGNPQTPNSAAPLTGDFQKTGDDFLQTIPEQDRAFVKKLANYDIDPKTLSTKGGEREKYLRMAVQANPDFDQKNYNAIYNAVNRFATGKQGDTVRSLNVAIEHMDTARRLGDALKNGDIPLVNKWANQFAEQTGKAAPTNFDAVKEIVADEVTKGVIGGAGALQDRAAAAAKIRNSSSPEQMNGVLNNWTQLLGGQLKGLEKQYEGATTRKDFKTRYLTPRAMAAYTGEALPTDAVTSPSGTPATNDLRKKYGL